MGMGLGNGQVVMVSRDKIMACMKCPLCNNLLKQATTISLCLHTFCRRCIYKRFSEDDVDSCPVCDIHLGCIPVDKLRPDHSLQDIRSKVFPFKRRKVEAPEIAPAISLPAKRKERSLSSLVVSTPRVQGGITGKRTRAGVRKGSGPGSASPSTEETPKKREDSAEDDMDGLSSPETLLEAANRTKFSKPGSGSADACTVKIEIGENGHRAEGEKSKMPSTLVPVKPRRMRRANKKRLSGSVESCSSKFILNVARRNWRDGPIWFSLVASADEKGVEPLPQVSAAFLRVKDTTMSVSSIQKYLRKKLDLASEEEVQVMCHGQPVMPQLKLSSLMDLWLRTSVTPKKVRTFVGQSAKDFTMVLSYSRKPVVAAS